MRDERPGIIKAITSPLGFFVLSLFIVETFLTFTLVFSDLSPENKFWGMIIGAILFLSVVVGVCWLVKTAPENLIFGEKSHLERERLKGVDEAKGTSAGVARKYSKKRSPITKTVKSIPKIKK